MKKLIYAVLLAVGIVFVRLLKALQKKNLRQNKRQESALKRAAK
jgi:hypothetical protein